MLAERADNLGLRNNWISLDPLPDLLSFLLHTDPGTMFSKSTRGDRAREMHCRHRISTTKRTQGADAHTAFALLGTHTPSSVRRLECNHTSCWGIIALRPPIQAYHALHTLVYPPQLIIQSHWIFCQFWTIYFLPFIFSLILQPTTHPSSLCFRVLPILQGFTIWSLSPRRFPQLPMLAFPSPGPTTHFTLFLPILQLRPHRVGFNGESMCSGVRGTWFKSYLCQLLTKGPQRSQLTSQSFCFLIDTMPKWFLVCLSSQWDNERKTPGIDSYQFCSFIPIHTERMTLSTQIPHLLPSKYFPGGIWPVFSCRTGLNANTYNRPLKSNKK